MKKTLIVTLFTLLAALMVACGGGAAEEAAAPVVEDVVEAVEAVEEAVMEEDAQEADTTFVINAAESSVEWRGAKAIGDAHFGTVNIASGTISVADGQLVGGEFELDMDSIINTDGLTGGMQDRLVGHLKSDDFFSVDTYPTASLVLTSAKSMGGDQYTVTGDLTVKGITKPIEFEATASEDGSSMTASAEFVIDRSEFDVRYGSGSFFDDLGDDLINDEIEMTVNLVASS